MRHLEIKICDDEKYYLNHLQSMILAAGSDLDYDIGIKTYLDVEELLQAVIEEKEECHMVFMDVEMPKMPGVDAARKLRRAGFEGVLCFVTSHQKYAMDAFDLEAMGYIEKPARYDEIKRFIMRACVYVFYQIDAEAASKRYMEIETQKKKFIVDIERILYIEQLRNRATIHLEDGEISCYESLKKIHSRLDKKKFVYAHQSYVVNFDKIMEVQPDRVMFGQGREVPLSRMRHKELRERHMDKIHQIRDQYRERQKGSQ